MWWPATSTEAHEMGAARVEVHFLGDRYQIELRIDPQTTLRRLELATGDIPTQEGASTSELERRLLARGAQLLRAVEIRFDGQSVTPRLEIVELLELEEAVPATPEPDESADDAQSADALMRQLESLQAQPGVEATLRFSGEIPPRAKHFSWGYSLVSSTYALILNDERRGQVDTQWLDAGTMSEPFELSGAGPSFFSVVRQYVVLGFTHILPKGLDHILFVLGIFLLSSEIKPVLAQVTAFTVAHTLTLGLSIYGLVSLPSSVVEPLIALSIVYVAVENVLTRELSRWRVLVVFGFGLLHGLGFAGVLSELGLPRSQFITALLSFNVGVELGQLAVIALAFVILASWSRKRIWYRQRIVVPASVAIALVGLFWTVQRVMP